MIWVGVDLLTAELFQDFYAKSGLEAPCPKQLEQALRRTAASFVIYEGSTPMGMCRLLGDDVLRFSIQDLMVLSPYRNMGVGRRLILEVERHIRSHLEPGWSATVEVVCHKKAEAFYRKMGFTRQQHMGMLKTVSKAQQMEPPANSPGSSPE